jgi:hypothetical protein
MRWRRSINLFRKRKRKMESAVVETPAGRVTLRKRGDIWYARKQHKMERFEVALGTGVLNEARMIAQEMVPARLFGVQQFADSSLSNPDHSHFALMFQKARSRAKTKNVDYSLTPDEEQDMIKRCAGTCELTGIPFSLARSEQSYRAPYRMSLDRIDVERGYTFQNSRIVCVAVNWALSDWGVGVFEKIAFAYAAKKLWLAAGQTGRGKNEKTALSGRE